MRSTPCWGGLKWHDDGRIEAGYVPLHVDAPGLPVVAEAADARSMTDLHGRRITRDAGLNPLSLSPRADMVVAA